MNSLSVSQRARTRRSPTGPGAGMAVVLPQRVSLRSVSCCNVSAPLHFSLHTCWCGRQIDKFDHHRASCEACWGEGFRGSIIGTSIPGICQIHDSCVPRRETIERPSDVFWCLSPDMGLVKAPFGMLFRHAQTDRRVLSLERRNFGHMH